MGIIGNGFMERAHARTDREIGARRTGAVASTEFGAWRLPC